MREAELREAFREAKFEVRLNEPLAPYTTFGIGGRADLMLFPRNLEDLQEALRRLRPFSLPLFIMGAGSNLLVSDSGFRGAAISTRQGFKSLSFREGGREVEAGGGRMLSGLLEAAASKGLRGLECTAGIPGTVGGAVAMNAGEAEQGIGKFIRKIQWLPLDDGDVQELAPEEVSFSYRETRLPGRGVILGATFELEGGTEAEAREALREKLSRRRRVQPLTERSAGSVFKNPPGESAGRLIHEAGLKGSRERGAVISEKHANFIVNRGGATARDVMKLIRLIRERVAERRGIWLELEICLVGMTEEEL